MANPTMSELMHAVREALPKVSASQARKLIKDNNIRSFGKIEAATSPLKEAGQEELNAQLGEPNEEEFPEMTTKTASKTSRKSAAGGKAHTKQRTVAKRGSSPRRQAATVEAGPRGFRFGEVWNQSIKDGAGPAFRPANINKLKAHADELGITYDRNDDAAAIAKKIARKL